MPTFIYDANSVTREMSFNKGTFHYLTVMLSNCALSGNVFVSTISTLEQDVQTEFEKISNLEMRGVGCSMVRGDTDSLTIGISAGFYTTSVKANLTETEATSLRVAANSAIASVANLTVSEVRVETTLIQRSTY